MSSLLLLDAKSMIIRDATENDLSTIVAIYNAAVPGRMATADLEPVTVASKVLWFNEHTPSYRPIWVMEVDMTIAGWLSFQSFYGRPAYHRTAEISIYVAPTFQRCGVGRQLLSHAISQSPKIGLKTLVSFIFAHNYPSLQLFETSGFERWGYLPRVAELDGAERDLMILGWTGENKSQVASPEAERLRLRASRRRMMKYSILIQWSKADQAYVASLPEWGYARTHGDTYEAALENAREVLADLIYGYEQTGNFYQSHIW